MLDGVRKLDCPHLSFGCLDESVSAECHFSPDGLSVRPAKNPPSTTKQWPLT